jgi:hypothetical protein
MEVESALFALQPHGLPVQIQGEDLPLSEDTVDPLTIAGQGRVGGADMAPPDAADAHPQDLEAGAVQGSRPLTLLHHVLLPSNLESLRARVSLPFPPEDSIP